MTEILKQEAIRRLRTPAAAAYLSLAPSTLEKDRVQGTLKIPFLKLGRAVAYDTAELDRWMEARRRTSTSDHGNSATEVA